MKCKNLEELINYMKNEIMQDDYERMLEINFGDDCIIMHVFESEVPIRIDYHTVYDYNNTEPEQVLLAQLDSELLRHDVGRVWLQRLDEICTLIEDNSEIFERLIKKGDK